MSLIIADVLQSAERPGALNVHVLGNAVRARRVAVERGWLRIRARLLWITCCYAGGSMRGFSPALTSLLQVSLCTGCDLLIAWRLWLRALQVSTPDRDAEIRGPLDGGDPRTPLCHTCDNPAMLACPECCMLCDR